MKTITIWIVTTDEPGANCDAIDLSDNCAHSVFTSEAAAEAACNPKWETITEITLKLED